MQKRHVLVCEGSLCPRELPDVNEPGLGEAGRYNYLRVLYVHLSFSENMCRVKLSHLCILLIHIK